MRLKKLLILGAARSGKDTLGEHLNQIFGFRYISSSKFANDAFIFDQLKHLHNYKTAEECFEDRINHRQLWFDLISAYNAADPLKLAKEILMNHDMYIGMRKFNEFYNSIYEDLFDLHIWVERPGFVEHEGSFDITLSDFMSLTKEKNSLVLKNDFNCPKAFVYYATPLISEKLK